MAPNSLLIADIKMRSICVDGPLNFAEQVPMFGESLVPTKDFSKSYDGTN